MWLLSTETCVQCNNQFDHFGPDDVPPPRTCSEACYGALLLGTKCLRCKKRDKQWRGLCLGCFRTMQRRAHKAGGWGPVIAEGLAAERSAGHGNPESKVCREPECGRKAVALGLCRLHRDRERRKERRQCQS